MTRLVAEAVIREAEDQALELRRVMYRDLVNAIAHGVAKAYGHG